MLTHNRLVAKNEESYCVEVLGDFDNPFEKMQSECVPNGLREGDTTALARPLSDLYWTHSLLQEVAQRSHNISDSQHREPEI